MAHLWKALITGMQDLLSLLRMHIRLLAIVIVLLVLILGVGVWMGWFGPGLPANVLVVFGDIETHGQRQLEPISG